MIVKRGNHRDYHRCYRPCRVSEVYGQDEAKKIIKTGLDSGSLSHTLLFHGPSGTGKTTFARIIAMGLLCETGPTSEPCRKCSSCRRVLNDNHLGFFDINTADDRGIDDVRKLKEYFEAGCLVDGTTKKIFLLDESHQLTEPAQQLLLKPAEAINIENYIIFSSTELGKFKKTLANRCMPIEFKPIPPEEIKRLLESVCIWERIKYCDDVLDSIVKESEGMVRNALFLLQKAVGLGKVEKMANGKVESIDRQKGSNVLIVAPHGVYHDDDYTGLIAKHLADHLEGYAVINEKYQKPKTVGFEEPDLDRDLVDLNSWEQINKYNQVQKEFLEPIDTFKNKIIKEHGTALIVQIHGIRNEHMNLVAKDVNKYRTKPENLHVLIGYGQSNGANLRLTADLAKTVQPLIEHLEDNNMNAVIAPTKEIIGIDGEKKIYCGNDPDGLNQRLYDPNAGVQCVQLEIRKSVFREDPVGAQQKAELLGKALFSLAVVTKPEEGKLPAQTTRATELVAASETELDTALVDRAYNTLEEIFLRHYGDAMLEAGRFIIKEFFGDDIESARANRPRKAESYKSLNQIIVDLRRQNSNAPSRSWIHYAVNIAVDAEDFKAVHTYGQLNQSQKVLLLSIDSREDKKKLIKETVDKGYTIKQLRNRLSEFKNNGKPKTDQTRNLPQLIRRPELLFSEDFSSVRAVESLVNLKLPTLNKLQDKAEEKITDIAKYIEGLESDVQTQNGYIEQYRTFINSVETAKKQKIQKGSKKPTWSWRNFLLYRSALQKAIRRCEVNEARYFAERLTHMGKPGANFEALLTIAAEDVGLADPTLITYVRQCNEEFRTLFKQININARDVINNPNLCEIIDKAVIAAAVSCKSRLLPQASFATLYKIYKEETFNHTISEYEECFLNAVQHKDEGKALYYAYILAIFLNSEKSVLSMILKESKNRNEEWIHDWVKEYKKRHHILYLAGSVVLLCRSLKHPHEKYKQLIFHHLSSPITEAEIPDRAYDKHTPQGREMGRGLKHFFRKGATVENEPFRNDWYCPGTKAYLYAEKQNAYLYGEKRKVSLAKTKNIIKATKKRFLITKLPFDYKRAVLTQARTSEYKVFAFVVELPKGKRKFMKGPFKSAELAQQHVIYNEVKRKLASKYLHPIKCEVKTYNDGSVFLECEELGKANLNKVTIEPPNNVDNQWFQVLDNSSNDVVHKPFDYLKSITKRNENIWVEVIINYCFRWIFRIGDAAERNLMLEKSTGKVYSTDEIRLKRKDVHPTIWNNSPAPKGVPNLMKQFVADHQLLNTVLDEVKRWKKSLKVISSQDFPITKGIKERIDRLLGHPEEVLGVANQPDGKVPNQRTER